MDAVFSWLAEHYQWKATLIVVAGVVATFVAGRIFLLVPAFRESHVLNIDAGKKRMERASYAEHKRMIGKWGALLMAIAVFVVAPFCLTLKAQPWLSMVIDVIAILFVYDFFYYLMHRFLFHDSALLGGPLMWVHAIHHRHHNPCRDDSDYVHPIELVMGVGLFLIVLAGVALTLGPVHVLPMTVAWVLYAQINRHNHTLWNAESFPFRYLNYLSVMHHNHHARFTGGNFATISLLFDWMFGTLDNGKGYRNEVRRQYKRGSVPAE